MLDLVLHNGRVLTQAAPPLAAAVGIRNGRIEVVGRAEDVMPAAGALTRRIDLAGRTLVPGLNDAHAHIWKIGHLLTTMLDLRGVAGMEDLTARIRAFAPRLPEGAWLLGRGYNEATMIEGRPPTRLDLDRAAPDRPVVLTRTCGHIYAVNSRALAAAGIGAETPSPVGGIVERDEAGQLTGLLHETAMGLVSRVMPPPGADDYEAMIVAALRHQLSSASPRHRTAACRRRCWRSTAPSTQRARCRRASTSCRCGGWTAWPTRCRSRNGSSPGSSASTR
jgi:predicted amidohydrolase YtcJ